MGDKVSLVTGATGLLAHQLIPALIERGDAVRALVLPHEDAASLEALGVTAFRGDVRDAGSVRHAVRGADTVFHLAAIHGLRRPAEEYNAVNVGGTENVCRAALEAGVTRLVHISTYSSYGPGRGEWVEESHALEPLPEPYGMSKAAADRLVQRLIAEEGLPAVILRPGTMIGPGDWLNFGRVADRLLAGRMIVIGSGRNYLPLVYVGEVVRGMLLASECPNAVGRAYNLGDDAPLTQEEFLREVADAVGARPPRLKVPFGLLYAAAYISEALAAAFGNRKQPLVTRLGLEVFGADNRLSIARARRELGYEPRVRVREAIQIAGEWYKSVQRAQRTPSGVVRSRRGASRA